MNEKPKRKRREPKRVRKSDVINHEKEARDLKRLREWAVKNGLESCIKQDGYFASSFLDTETSKNSKSKP